MKKNTEMFSSAFNNMFNLSGSADPQTGTFSFAHSFGKVQANTGLGPHCSLIMSFSGLSTFSGNTTGLGSGWSFRLARYNRASKLLTLNTGETFNVLQVNHNAPWELSHKLKDILVKQKKEKDKNLIYIYHKNGDIEILQVSPPFDDAYLWRFISPSGHYLEFSYQQMSGYNRLTQIEDSASSVLTTVTYLDDKYQAKITMYPHTPEEAASTVYYQGNGLVRNIQLQNGQNISLDYETFHFPNNHTLQLIKNATYPTGASEQVEYEEALYLPPGAPIQYLPAVSQHVKIVGTSQPPIVTTFKFEKQSNGQPGPNFWGYLAGNTWQPDYDNLYDYPSEYSYSSVATCGDKVVTQKYNKFHQTLSMVEANSTTHQKIITNEYYSNGSKPLSEQPTTYELIKQKTITYKAMVTSKCATHSEVKSYIHDDWGNVLTKVDITGVSTVNAYYPTEGEKDKCPPHPCGMVFYLKQKLTHANDKSSSKIYDYTYTSVDGANHSKSVLLATMAYSDSMQTYAYYNNTTPELQCKLKTEVVTVRGKSTSFSHNYTVNKNTILVAETKTGHDGLTTCISRKKSAWSGLMFEETNEAGVSIKYTYDISNRLMSQTMAEGSDYETTTTYTYTDNPKLPSGNDYIGTLVKRESSFVSSHVYFNGDHQHTATYRKDEFGILRKVAETKYDDHGRLLSQTKFDYVIDPESNHRIQSTYTNGVTYVYGSWGERKETHYNTGVIELNDYDPITRQVTHQIVRRDDSSNPSKVTASSSLAVETHDSFRNITKVETFDLSGHVYSTTLYSYDGFGRKISITTPLQSIAKVLEYDEFDRQVKIEQFDGTPFSVSYIDFSSEKKVSSIEMPSCDFTAGEQEFDGLSRVIGKRVNGVQTTFSYQSGLRMPSRQLNGRNQTVLFGHIPELGNKCNKVASYSGNVQVGDWSNKTKILEKEFTYAKSNDPSCPKVGRVLTASSPAACYSYKYKTTGYMETSSQKVDTQSKSCKYTNSLSGKPLRMTFDDREIALEYDMYGHLIATSDGSLKTEAILNSFNHVVKLSVKQFDQTTQSYVLLQITNITYDEYSRETSREISFEDKGGSCLLQLFYDVESKIVKRMTTVNSDEFVTELLTYDKHSRLVKYDASNYTTESLLPRNEYGNVFVSQKLAYDQLNNITSIITKFPGKGEFDEAKYLYDKINKQQLKKISHSLTTGPNAYHHPIILLTYDEDGNAVSINDTKMTYTVSGRMESKDNTEYSYDPYDRLVITDKAIRYYMGSKVGQEVDGSEITNFICHGDVPVAEITDGISKIYGTDQKFSVVTVTDDKSTTNTIYGPFGTSADNTTRTGYNGELKDTKDPDMYPLGNGTRSYFPGIPGFLAQDSFSPFLGGGFNPYMYCNGNPINASDPTGHFSFSNIFGIVAGAVVSVAAIAAAPFTGGSSIAIACGVIGGCLGLVSTGLSIGVDVAVSHHDSSLARKLGIASTVIGAVGSVVSIAQGGAEMANVLRARSIINVGETGEGLLHEDIMCFKFRLKFSRSPPESPSLRAIFRTTREGRLQIRDNLLFKTREFAIGHFSLIEEQYDRAMFIKGGELRSVFGTITKNLQVRSFISGAFGGAALAIRRRNGIPSNDDHSDGDHPDNHVNQAVNGSHGLPTNAHHHGDSEDDGDIFI